MASANVSLMVNSANNSAPVFTSTSNLPAGDSAKSYTFQVAASDPDLDQITFGLVNPPTGMSISTNGLISWNSPVAGSYRFSVIADDGKLTATQNLSLFIDGTTVNQPPVITSDPVVIGYRNIAYSYDVQAIDPEEQSLKYTLLRKPNGMTINSKGFISWLPTREGNYAVTVKVTDSKGSFSFQNFTIAVYSRGSWSGSSLKEEKKDNGK